MTFGHHKLSFTAYGGWFTLIGIIWSACVLIELIHEAVLWAPTRLLYTMYETDFFASKIADTSHDRRVYIWVWNDNSQYAVEIKTNHNGS